MKILISNNEMFGGFIGRLINDNNTTVELPTPFNVGATRYTGRDKGKIINQCREEAGLIFNLTELGIIDTTEMDIETWKELFIKR